MNTISEHLECRKICKQHRRNEHNVFINKSLDAPKIKVHNSYLLRKTTVCCFTRVSQGAARNQPHAFCQVTLLKKKSLPFSQYSDKIFRLTLERIPINTAQFCRIFHKRAFSRELQGGAVAKNRNYKKKPAEAIQESTQSICRELFQSNNVHFPFWKGELKKNEQIGFTQPCKLPVEVASH